MSYRIANVIQNYFPALVVVLAFLAVLGGFWLYVSSQPSYETRRVLENSFGVRGSYNHEAEVLVENPVWEEGKVLENRRAYFLKVSPKLRLTFNHEVFGADKIDGLVTADIDLVLESVEEGEKEKYVYWKKTYDLGENTSPLSENPALLTVDLNVLELENRMENIQENLGFHGGTATAKVVSTVSVKGEVEGENVDTSRTYTAVLELGRESYTVGGNLVKEEVFEKYATETIEKKPSWAGRVPSLLLLILPLAGLAYISLRRREIDESTLKELRKEHERDKFEEWISRGKLPDRDYEDQIKIETLEDLVDAAVDMGNRVIYDEEKSTHFIIQEGVLYKYTHKKRTNPKKSRE